MALTCDVVAGRRLGYVSVVVMRAPGFIGLVLTSTTGSGSRAAHQLGYGCGSAVDRAILQIFETGLIADTVSIVDAAGKRTDLAAAEIDTLDPLSTSLRPEQLPRDLTAGLAADLLVSLETLE